MYITYDSIHLYSCVHIMLSNAWSHIPGYTKAIVQAMILVDFEAASMSGVRAAVRAFTISAQAVAATLRITVVWLYIRRHSSNVQAGKGSYHRLQRGILHRLRPSEQICCQLVFPGSVAGHA